MQTFLGSCSLSILVARLSMYYSSVAYHVLIGFGYLPLERFAER
jgi:hypothetical protein